MEIPNKRIACGRTDTVSPLEQRGRPKLRAAARKEGKETFWKIPQAKYTTTNRHVNTKVKQDAKARSVIALLYVIHYRIAKPGFGPGTLKVTRKQLPRKLGCGFL